MLDLAKKSTETRNPSTLDIDKVDTLEMLRIFNNEDKKVAYAVEKELENIATAVDEIFLRLNNGGRLFYCGAGTSGRLGILDAVECPPTFSVPDTLVQGVIAGGYGAIFKAVEGAEDDVSLCQKDLEERRFCSDDVLFGIAASGSTPYVLGGLKYAKSIGALTVGLSCNDNSPISSIVDVAITPVVGAEVITGSTRLKAGTAEKMVLNMVSTGVMVKLGKVYGNLMVDLKVSNNKLQERAIRIVQEACGVSKERAVSSLKECNGEVKTAIIHILTGIEVERARDSLSDNGGVISRVLRSF